MCVTGASSDAQDSRLAPENWEWETEYNRRVREGSVGMRQVNSLVGLRTKPQAFGPVRYQLVTGNLPPQVFVEVTYLLCGDIE